MPNFQIIALTPAMAPAALPHAGTAIAAARAGETGVVDLEFADSALEAEPLAEYLQALPAVPEGRLGIKCDIRQIDAWSAALHALAGRGADGGRMIILTGELQQADTKPLKARLSKLHKSGFSVLVEVTDLEQALLAERAGADGVIAKGHEAGGQVGDATTFVLLQRLIKRLELPVWARGGIGVHTAAACRAAGAAGVVLDNQLLLVRESSLPAELKARLARLDGSETTVVSGPGGLFYRLFCRPGSPTLEELQAELRTLETEAEAGRLPDTEHLRRWQEAVRRSVSGQAGGIAALGQDVAFAQALARRHVSVGGILQAILRSSERHLETAARLSPLAEHSPLARSHNTRYPIVQGAMTRVSDCADFAVSVAREGALPFLALAVMRQGEIERLLAETKEKAAELPWGVGILGFVPQELRQEQLEVIKRYRPPFALIAGGRPDQAKALEDVGIKTYLHVPSPLLLRSFIEMGSRRFIFEGKECGGHVGPRSSFVLWESMVEVILASIGPKDEAADFHVVFAGGIHDDLSASMVAALSAPLAERGVRVGVLMGTAYLFTKEAVDTGAIVERFQKEALACDRTVLLETGPGHSIRCIDSPYRRTFNSRRRKLEQEGLNRNEVRQELELLNLGRLRIASKGLARAEGAGSLAPVDEERQWSEGMYMVGQVASMHDTTMTVAELHEKVATGGSARLAALVQPAPAPVAAVAAEAQEGIAIVGMSCLFPGANSLDEFWDNILNKVDAVTEIPKEQWDWEPLYDPNPLARDKIRSKWGGFLQDMVFDPVRYGIPPSTLTSVDPMQLIVLEATRAALGDAGYAEREFHRDRTSVILANAGHGPITAFYSLRSMLDWTLRDMDPEYRKIVEQRLPEWSEDVFPGYLGNVTAGRVANRFDLGGLNFSVDAACASSLAALYVSMRDLRTGHSDMVILAATDTHNQPGDYLSFSKVHALSPTGRCRTFDSSADGIVISEGIAVLVLKRLSDARRDGDRVYAVIRGIGGSSDGRDLSLTAPRPAGQMLALRRAYEDAGVSPASVELVEAHGTGTVAGDKAEVEALKQVFAEAGADPQACAIGSVKTMIGHTKCAAGLASLIKAAKALHHKVLPPTLGVETPNPSCNFPESPFYINSESRPWIHRDRSAPRRAGVSAFGFGGTNFHAVLEEDWPQSPAPAESATRDWPSELFFLRGASRQQILKSLDSLEELGRKAQTQPDLPQGPVRTERRPNLRTVAHHWHLSSAAAERPPGSADLCLALVASSLADLAEKLDRARQSLSSGAADLKDPRGIYFSEEPLARGNKVAFLFPGQGSQHVDMLRDLALAFPEARAVFEEADSVLSARLPQPLSRYVFPAPAFSAEERERQQSELTDTHVAQPAMAAADLAALQILSALGLRPDMVAGHSFGEYVALAASGALSSADLFRLSEKRGRLLAGESGRPSGAMAAVTAAATEVKQLLERLSGVTLANINAPNQCILAGDDSAIEKAVQVLSQHNLRARKISVSAAFHSPHMKDAADGLKAALESVRWASPRLPVFSNTDAGPHPSEPRRISARLLKHLVEPVQFLDEIERMYEEGARLFVEVGPGSVLTGLVDAILEGRPHLAVSLDRSGRPGLTQLQHTLAQLASQGSVADLGRLFNGRLREPLEFEALERGGAGPDEPARQKLAYVVNSARIEPLSLRAGTSTQTAAQSATWRDQAKKAASAKAGAPSLSSSPTSRTAMNSGTNNGANGAASSHPAATPARAAAVTPRRRGDAADDNGNRNQPAAAASAEAATALPGYSSMKPQAGSPADSVMLEFQRTMLQMTQSFLETQQNVMLAYLNAGSGPALAAGSPPAPGIAGILERAATPFGPAPAGGNGHEPQQPHRSVSDSDYACGNGGAPAGAGASGTVAPEAGSEPCSGPDSGGGSAGGLKDDLNPEELIASLMSIVSDRTGYPPEMLDPSLDLEADLGIDSIKRVEILNSFRKLLPEARQSQLEGGLERLAGIKTLQGIMDWIREDLHSTATGTTSSASGDMTGSTPEPAGGAEDTIRSRIGRGAIEVVDLPPASVPDSLSGTVLIADYGLGAGEMMSERVSALGASALLVTHEPGAACRGSAAVLTADLSSPDGVDQLFHRLGEEGSLPDKLVFLPAAGSPPLSEISATPARSLFLLAKAWLGNAAEDGTPRTLLSATRIGGDFASSDEPSVNFDPLHGGVVGLVKSLARELPHLTARAVDFQPEADHSYVTERLLAELVQADERLEVGYRSGRRLGLEVVPRPLPALPPDGEDVETILDPSSLVLVTGGARGITAEICLRLASRYQPTFVIVGRMPRPQGEEPEDTAKLQSPRDIKAAIMERLRQAGEPISVPAVESVYQTLVREREMRRTIDSLERLGSRVRYYAVDVRDDEAFSQLIDTLYETYGRIDGVIHGAGVIEDAWLRNKSFQSFERVFDTKVKSALTLARKLHLSELKFLYFFSSVVGRTGNAGQCDYVAANEVLSKLAVQLGRRAPGKVASIMWGPWRGGMAQPEMESIFARYGWAMIEPEEGARCFDDELRRAIRGQSEVLLVGQVDAPVAGGGGSEKAAARPGTASGASPRQRAAARGPRLFLSEPASAGAKAVEYRLRLSTDQDLYLNDHTLDGMPVMPMAMSVELMCEAALSAYPGYSLAAIEDLDIPSGIVIEQHKDVAVVVEEESRNERQVTVKLSVVTEGAVRRTCFKAIGRLTAERTAQVALPAGLPVRYELPQVVEPEKELPDPEIVYGKWLFHGPLFQGISRVEALGLNAIAGRLSVSSPQDCLRQTNGEPWVIGPVLLDSAMQMAGAWARHYMDVTCLPTGVRSLRLVKDVVGTEFSVIVRIPPETGASEMTCDLAVYDAAGALTFIMEGLSGIGSKSFNRFTGKTAELRTAP